MSPRISICAPAFDEEACIEEVVRGFVEMLDREGLDGEVVITDDGSRDRTPEILARMAADEPRIRVITPGRNQGYGLALRAAIAAAKGDFVVTIDSDGQFDPNDVPRLLARQREGGFDLVTGHRVRKRDTPLRVGADLGLRALVRALFGVRVKDPNCALKLIAREWIQNAPLEARGYPTPTEIVVRAHHDGLAIADIPVAHLPRAGGTTKLRLLRTASSAARFLLELRLRL